MERKQRASRLRVFAGLAIFLFCAADSAAGGAAVQSAQVAQGLAITPVPLNLHGRDQNLVGLGSYLVNAVTACNDCHTDPAYAPGHDPFQGGDGQVNAAGYLKGGRNFGNGIVSPDLTPDANGLPGGLTIDQFLYVMSCGRDPSQPGRILQVMPWPVYRHMSEDDQRAIYAYLEALPRSPPPR